MDTLIAVLLHRDPSVRLLYKWAAAAALVALFVRYAFAIESLTRLFDILTLWTLYWAVNLSLWPASPCALEQRLATACWDADALLDNTMKHSPRFLDPVFFRGHRVHVLFGAVFVTPRSAAELDDDALCWMIVCAHLRAQMYRTFATNLILALAAVIMGASIAGWAGGLNLVWLTLAALVVFIVAARRAAHKRDRIARAEADRLMEQEGLGERVSGLARKWTYASAFDHRGALSILDE